MINLLLQKDYSAMKTASQLFRQSNFSITQQTNQVSQLDMKLV